MHSDSEGLVAKKSGSFWSSSIVTARSKMVKWLSSSIAGGGMLAPRFTGWNFPGGFSTSSSDSPARRISCTQSSTNESPPRRRLSAPSYSCMRIKSMLMWFASRMADLISSPVMVVKARYGTSIVECSCKAVLVVVRFFCVHCQRCAVIRVNFTGKERVSKETSGTQKGQFFFSWICLYGVKGQGLVWNTWTNDGSVGNSQVYFKPISRHVELSAASATVNKAPSMTRNSTNSAK